MSALSDIQDLYDKVNANTVAVAALTAEVKTLTCQNAALMSLNQQRTEASERLFKWLGASMFLLIMFLSGIIGYGAIGKQGMYTVRETTPITTWHNDLDDWHSGDGQNKTTK